MAPRRGQFSAAAIQQEKVDKEIILRITQKHKTVKLALYYLFILRKVTKTFPDELPDQPHAVCAFIASEQYAI